MQVCLSLTVPFTLCPASAASLGAFFSFSFCHLYSLFSFLQLQGCFQQSPGRQSYLEAQPVLLLSLGYVLKHLAGARPRWGAWPQAQPCLGHCQLWPLAGARQSQGLAGRAGEGQLYTGTQRGLLCVCRFWSGMLLIKWGGEMPGSIFFPLGLFTWFERPFIFYLFLFPSLSLRV